MRYWTYYWGRVQVLGDMEELDETGLHDFLQHTAGNGYAKAGVAEGDQLYVVNFLDGILGVLGRMTVGECLDRAGAVARFGENVYDAPEHIVAQEGTATPKVFDAVLSDQDLDEIEFLNATGAVAGIKRNKAAEVEPQTFRNVREITVSTAELFDLALGFAAGQSFGDGKPGRRMVTFGFVVRDDDGSEVEVVTTLLCEADGVLPRDVGDEIVSVTDGSLLSAPDALAPLLWERVERRCDELNAVVIDEGVPFAQLVQRSLDDSAAVDD